MYDYNVRHVNWGGSSLLRRQKLNENHGRAAFISKWNECWSFCCVPLLFISAKLMSRKSGRNGWVLPGAKKHNREALFHGHLVIQTNPEARSTGSQTEWTVDWRGSTTWKFFPNQWQISNGWQISHNWIIHHYWTHTFWVMGKLISKNDTETTPRQAPGRFM